MKGWHSNIERDTLENQDFRRVLYTGKHCQLVLMSLKPGEEIGAEVHAGVDQFFRIDAGAGQVIIDDNEYAISNGDAIVVPAGASHNVVNTSETEDLKLYTLYSPPEHQDGIVRATKAEALSQEEHFDGKTTE